MSRARTLVLVASLLAGAVIYGGSTLTATPQTGAGQTGTVATAGTKPVTAGTVEVPEPVTLVLLGLGLLGLSAGRIRRRRL